MDWRELHIEKGNLELLRRNLERIHTKLKTETVIDIQNVIDEQIEVLKDKITNYHVETVGDCKRK